MVIIVYCMEQVLLRKSFLTIVLLTHTLFSSSPAVDKHKSAKTANTVTKTRETESIRTIKGTVGLIIDELREIAKSMYVNSHDSLGKLLTNVATALQNFYDSNPNDLTWQILHNFYEPGILIRSIQDLPTESLAGFNIFCQNTIKEVFVDLPLFPQLPSEQFSATNIAYLEAILEYVCSKPEFSIYKPMISSWLTLFKNMQSSSFDIILYTVNDFMYCTDFESFSALLFAITEFIFEIIEPEMTSTEGNKMIFNNIKMQLRLHFISFSELITHYRKIVPRVHAKTE